MKVNFVAAIMAGSLIVSPSVLNAIDWKAIGEKAAGGAINNLTSKIPGGSIGLPGIFGETQATLKCRSSSDLDIASKLPNMDVCKVNEKIDGLLSKFKNNSWDLGFCSIGMSDNLKCEAEEAKRFCKERGQKPVGKIVSGVRTGERNINDAGRVNTVFTGGDKVAKKSMCDNVSETISKFPEQITAQTNATALSGTGAYGNILNTRQYRAVEECYASMLKAGKSTTDANRYCSPYSIAATKSGLSSMEIQNQSMKTATETLKTPLTKSAETAAYDEAALANKLSQECSKYTDQAAIAKCASDIIEGDVKLVEKTDIAIASIETAEAGKMKLFTEATEHRKSITHPTEAAKNNLPIEQRMAYAGAAKRSMAQEALISSYGARVSEIKKELALLMSQKKEIMSRPFYGQAESTSISSSLNGIVGGLFGK